MMMQRSSGKTYPILYLNLLRRIPPCRFNFDSPDGNQLCPTKPGCTSFQAIGQQLRTGALPTTQTMLRLHSLPTGMYALRVTLAGDPDVVQRVVVQ